MDLRLERLWPSEACTIGRLYVDGVLKYFTLEDKDREIPGKIVAEWKVPGETAIPRGHYLVEITYSQRFHRYMPQVMAVPGFEGVRIHAGNKAADSSGCILVGMSKGPNRIYESRKAYDLLYVELAEALERGESIILEIT